MADIPKTRGRKAGFRPRRGLQLVNSRALDTMDSASLRALSRQASAIVAKRAGTPTTYKEVRACFDAVAAVLMGQVCTASLSPGIPSGIVLTREVLASVPIAELRWIRIDADGYMDAVERALEPLTYADGRIPAYATMAAMDAVGRPLIP